MLGLAFQDDGVDFEAALAEFISELGGLVGAGSGQRNQKPDRVAAKQHEPKRLQPRRHIAQVSRSRSQTRLERPMQGAGDVRPQHDHRHGAHRKKPRSRGEAAGATRESGRAEAAAEINSLRLYLANLGQAAGFEITEDGG